MVGGRLGKISWLAAFAAAGFLTSAMATGATAADLGGDCCADLEERVAELEATTARKGNRKVSLTVSGQVNQTILFWDDGQESNVYVVDMGNASSRFRFVGKAQITPDWSAGYLLEIEAYTNRGGVVNQTNDDLGGAITLRQSNWWLESKQLGRITVGQGSSATDDIILADVEGVNVIGYSDYTLLFGGFFIVGTDATYGDIAPNLDTTRRNIVRYDSPTFGGFKIVAAYGEDDFWDVGLWWSGKLADQITYAGGVGYLQNSCRNPIGSCEAISGLANYKEWKGSASFLHNPTGLFASGAFVSREFDGVGPDTTYWYLRSGVVAKGMVPLGKTVFFGEYGNGEGGLDGDTISVAGVNRVVSSSEMSYWGLGIVQHIDAAAMELYINYKNADADISGTGFDVDPDNLHLVYTGARIRF